MALPGPSSNFHQPTRVGSVIGMIGIVLKCQRSPVIVAESGWIPSGKQNSIWLYNEFKLNLVTENKRNPAPEIIHYSIASML